MKKLLLLNNGMKFHGIETANALSAFYDVYLWNNGSETPYKYRYEDYNPTPRKYTQLSWEEAKKTKFDIAFGLEQSCCVPLFYYKKFFPDALVGCYVLDIPVHAWAKNTKDYIPHSEQAWDQYFQYFVGMDFILTLMHHAKKDLDRIPAYDDIIKLQMDYPFNRQMIGSEPDVGFDKFIFYSGRVHQHKGVENIIKAISMIPADIPLVVVGDGWDLTDYAKYCNVKYRQIVADEAFKWACYESAHFVVCGSDVPYIASLCPKEAASVYRPSVVHSTDENKLHYGDFAVYTDVLNTKHFAERIFTLWLRDRDEIMLDKEKCDLKYNEHWSYDAYALNLYSFLEQ